MNLSMGLTFAFMKPVRQVGERRSYRSNPVARRPFHRWTCRCLSVNMSMCSRNLSMGLHNLSMGLALFIQTCRCPLVNVSMSSRNLSMGLHNLSTGLALFDPNLFDSFPRQNSNLSIVSTLSVNRIWFKSHQNQDSQEFWISTVTIS